MAGISAIQMRKYLEVYNGFEGVSTLVDVGGGVGQSLKIIISKYPNIKKGIEHIGGNMYVSVLKGDAVMVKATCLNWSEEKCVVPLKNCHTIPQNGKVIIFDMIMPEEAKSSDVANQELTHVFLACSHYEDVECRPPQKEDVERPRPLSRRG
ncbi:isoliquiritigenin 2'-O-methyltransferase-like [Senna tora]|uniref:Isoliquiritigenin 2'-O-methyltransferase-like n=1 Tax=Senna tora TaxID=362788 RepID=A0A834WCA1_9FABA|nr:isoliquiritigenin 2'-O-methyltransferase-like [Senna tora]